MLGSLATAVVFAAGALWFDRRRRRSQDRQRRFGGAGATNPDDSWKQPLLSGLSGHSHTSGSSASGGGGVRGHSTSESAVEVQDFASGREQNAAAAAPAAAAAAPVVVDSYCSLLHTSDTSGGGGSLAVTVVPAPVQAAEYEAGTGTPLNMVAKTELALFWRTGEAAAAAAPAAAAAGGGDKPPRMVQLPFAELEGATQGFSDFNMLGGGASCAVHMGRCFGVPVAIKRLSLVAPVPPTRSPRATGSCGSSRRS